MPVDTLVLGAALLTGLLGGVFAALSRSLEAPSVLIAGLIAFTAVFAWFKSREATQDADFSVTGVVAALFKLVDDVFHYSPRPRCETAQNLTGRY